MRRTILDCLAHLPRGEAERLWAYVSSRSLLSQAHLLEAIADRRGHRGTGQLRHFADLAGRGAANPAEVRLHEILRAAGLTQWRAGVPVKTPDGLIVARPDVLFEREKVAIELDGARAHGPDQFQSDRARQNRLVELGYTPLHFTWADLRDRAEQVVATVRRTLALAQPA
ncbi:DUF559 domain-containing protein [Occultella glacieicola]|uniref:DUF559 domain-containing protein n=1 Tax=Occultella glacieicola TaxID=2518684 RepID=A0ABY2E4U6_9MICO|nr:DUF559 domain-containing protein [Occultella glacieicola]TDE94144.1 DUF559 domain-containing protein [Occultella glacieicola]